MIGVCVFIRFAYFSIFGGVQIGKRQTARDITLTAKRERGLSDPNWLCVTDCPRVNAGRRERGAAVASNVAGAQQVIGSVVLPRNFC